MTGGEGSRPVYSYNRGKRVRENRWVRRQAKKKRAVQRNYFRRVSNRFNWTYKYKR